MPQSQTRMPHWWLSVWKQSKHIHFPEEFTISPLRLKLQTGTFQVRRGCCLGIHFLFLTVSVKQLITDQVVGLNNDAALKKRNTPTFWKVQDASSLWGQFSSLTLPLPCVFLQNQFVSPYYHIQIFSHFSFSLSPCQTHSPLSHTSV